MSLVISYLTIFFFEFGNYDVDSDRVISNSILKAINEGCADFFAYVFTNRVDELSDSDSSAFRNRLLPVTFSSLDLELGSSNCYEGEYCWGSIFASALYDVSLHQSIGRLNVAKNLFHSIKEFRIDWDQHKESETFEFY